jgi:hypothetical protein
MMCAGLSAQGQQPEPQIEKLAVLPPIVSSGKIDAAFSGRMRSFLEEEMTKLGAFDMIPREDIDRETNKKKPQKKYDYESLHKTFGTTFLLVPEINLAYGNQLYLSCFLFYNGQRNEWGTKYKATLNKATVTAANDMAAFGAALEPLLDKLGIEPIPYANYITGFSDGEGRPDKYLGPVAEATVGADGQLKRIKTTGRTVPPSYEFFRTMTPVIMFRPLQVNGVFVESKVLVFDGTDTHLSSPKHPKQRQKLIVSWAKGLGERAKRAETH